MIYGVRVARFVKLMRKEEKKLRQFPQEYMTINYPANYRLIAETLSIATLF